MSFLKVSKWSQKSFLKISENYTFESVKIESVGVDAHSIFWGDDRAKTDVWMFIHIQSVKDKIHGTLTSYPHGWNHLQYFINDVAIGFCLFLENCAFFAVQK